MWWEYIDAEPELQIDHGVIPWLIYGEPLNLLVHHMLGYRPLPDGILIQPHLLPELGFVSAKIRNGSNLLNLSIHNKGRYVQRAELDGKVLPEISADNIFFEVPESDVTVEIWLGPSK
jgi:hypothetical protein